MDELAPVEDFAWQPRTMTNVPAELVMACAQGLEDPDVIAERFGLTGPSWAQLKESKPFQLAVAAKKAELEKNGWVFRQKAAMGAEMVLEKVIIDLMSNETSTNTRIEGLKTLAKLANLEPKEEKVQSSAPAFQININIPGNTLTLDTNNVIDIKQEAVE